jgi:hypothetical protein
MSELLIVGLSMARARIHRMYDMSYGLRLKVRYDPKLGTFATLFESHNCGLQMTVPLVDHPVLAILLHET